MRTPQLFKASPPLRDKGLPHLTGVCGARREPWEAGGGPLGSWAGSGTIAHCRALSRTPLASSTRRRPRQRRSRACGRSSSPPRASSALPCRAVSPAPPPAPAPPCPPRLRTRSRRNPTSAPGLRVRACCRPRAHPSPPLAQVPPGSVRPPPGERTRARRHAPAPRPPRAPQLRRAPGERPPRAPTGDDRGR